MEDAEAVLHGRDRVYIVLHPIRRLGLDNEQCAIRLHEMAQLSQRLVRSRKVVNAIAGGDEVKAFASFQLAGGIGDELDAVTKAGLRCRGARLSDRFRVWIRRSR